MKKYYYYDVNGELHARLTNYIKLISEKPLPGFSRKYSGCSIGSPNIPLDTPLNKKIKVAFGDPRVFDCSVVSFSKTITKSETIKEHISRLLNEYLSLPVTLAYKGGKVWSTHQYLCLVKDLKIK